MNLRRKAIDVSVPVMITINDAVCRQRERKAALTHRLHTTQHAMRTIYRPNHRVRPVEPSVVQPAVNTLVVALAEDHTTRVKGQGGRAKDRPGDVIAYGVVDA